MIINTRRRTLVGRWPLCTYIISLPLPSHCPLTLHPTPHILFNFIPYAIEFRSPQTPVALGGLVMATVVPLRSRAQYRSRANNMMQKAQLRYLCQRPDPVQCSGVLAHPVGSWNIAPNVHAVSHRGRPSQLPAPCLRRLVETAGDGVKRDQRTAWHSYIEHLIVHRASYNSTRVHLHVIMR